MRLLSAFLPLRLKGGSPNSHRAIGNAMRRWLARLRASSALIATAARDGAWPFLCLVPVTISKSLLWKTRLHHWFQASKLKGKNEDSN